VIYPTPSLFTSRDRDVTSGGKGGPLLLSRCVYSTGAQNVEFCFTFASFRPTLLCQIHPYVRRRYKLPLLAPGCHVFRRVSGKKARSHLTCSVKVT